MRVILLGTGAALPDPDRCHTSILVTLNNGRHFLLDCGHGATHQLVRSDVNPADVEAIFLTHLHHDHVCDLPFLVISGWMLGRVGSLAIYGPST
jgi:ribonuclease Z